MYGPNWSDPNRGVTGELVSSKPNYETYTDDQGVLRTRILGSDDSE